MLAALLITTTLLFNTPQKEVPLKVEVVKEKEEKQKGLQGRDFLPQNEGMLFYFEKEGHYPFWMKNTSIPLGLIFINKKAKIVDIQYGTPFSEEIIKADSPYKYVLEVNLSFIQKNHIRTDQHIKNLPNNEKSISKATNLTSDKSKPTI